MEYSSSAFTVSREGGAHTQVAPLKRSHTAPGVRSRVTYRRGSDEGRTRRVGHGWGCAREWNAICLFCFGFYCTFNGEKLCLNLFRVSGCFFCMTQNNARSMYVHRQKTHNTDCATSRKHTHTPTIPRAINHTRNSNRLTILIK